MTDNDQETILRCALRSFCFPCRSLLMGSSSQMVPQILGQTVHCNGLVAVCGTPSKASPPVQGVTRPAHSMHVFSLTNRCCVVFLCSVHRRKRWKPWTRLNHRRNVDRRGTRIRRSVKKKKAQHRRVLEKMYDVKWRDQPLHTCRCICPSASNVSI
jgi:hypothetical protein